MAAQQQDTKFTSSIKETTTVKSEDSNFATLEGISSNSIFLEDTSSLLSAGFCNRENEGCQNGNETSQAVVISMVDFTKTSVIGYYALASRALPVAQQIIGQYCNFCLTLVTFHLLAFKPTYSLCKTRVTQVRKLRKFSSKLQQQGAECCQTT